MPMSFRTQRVLEKIQGKEFINISDLIKVFEDDMYLPNNRSDAYYFLSILLADGYITKIKRGLYKVEKAFIKKELGALK